MCHCYLTSVRIDTREVRVEIESKLRLKSMHLMISKVSLDYLIEINTNFK